MSHKKDARLIWIKKKTKTKNDRGSLLVCQYAMKNCCWLVGFVALRPKSTAMVIAGRSVHLTTLFPGQA